PSPSAAPTPRPSSGMSTTGSLATGRWGNSTTVLDDGRVLVVGGFSGADAGVVSMAELYDPKTGKFTRTAALNRPRALHTATVLSDGRVLIAGGMSDTIAPVQAEVYDPKTGQFTTTGSLTAIRWGHTAVRLADGRVLVMGGETTVNGNSYSVLDTAELYDPETGTFSPTGSMASFRVWYTATLLTDGRVLVVGGSYGTSTNTYPKVAELYDPSTGKFSVTGSLAIGRSGHTATRLADGRVLIAGGKDDSSIFASAELYDPTTGKFTTTGSMSSARDYPTSTLLPDGRVLIAGGRNWSGGAWENYASTEIYNPATGKFTSGSPLAVARSRHTAVTLQDGSILLVGGRVEGPSIKACELYQP
ncbi:MAG: kelch repeat-containing protein, partial [Candidatus Limnocylindrales bacterium]